MSDNRNKRGELNRPTREITKEIPREILEMYDDNNVMGKFHVDLSAKPEGYTYEWKKISVMGKEDKQYQVTTLRKSWKPVPGGRHPEAGGHGDEPIIIDGLMLMECPDHIVKFFQEKAAEKNTIAMNTQEHIRHGGSKEMPRVVQQFSRSIEPALKVAQPIPV